MEPESESSDLNPLFVSTTHDPPNQVFPKCHFIYVIFSTLLASDSPNRNTPCETGSDHLLPKFPPLSKCLHIFPQIKCHFLYFQPLEYHPSIQLWLKPATQPTALLLTQSLRLHALLVDPLSSQKDHNVHCLVFSNI